MVFHMSPCQSRQRHESSNFHKNAVKALGQSDQPTDLPLCTGLRLSSATGSGTQMGSPEMLPLVKLWVDAGCIACLGSALETLSAKLTEDGDIIIRDTGCQKSEASKVFRGGDSCNLCVQAANRPKACSLVRDWAKRISVVDLLHTTLGSKQEQLCQANQMVAWFPEMVHDQLHGISYSNAVTKARNMFIHIATSKQNAALQNFIGRSLKFLSPTLIAGVPAEHQKEISSFVDALAEGRLQGHESKAIVPRIFSFVHFSKFSYSFSRVERFLSFRFEVKSDEV